MVALIRSTLRQLYQHVIDPWQARMGPGTVRYYPPRIKVLLFFRERRALFRFASETGGTVVEIGCYNGGSTHLLAAGAARRGGRVVSMDPFDTNLDEQIDREDPEFTEGKADECVAYYAVKPTRASVERFLREQGHSNVQLITGYSYEIVQGWKDPISLLFIDGNHEYSAVRQDFDDWSRFVVPSGYVLIHDSSPAGSYAGPPRVVNEVLAAGGYERIALINTLSVLRKLP